MQAQPSVVPVTDYTCANYNVGDHVTQENNRTDRSNLIS
jgi:hypothetical protein